MDEDHTILWDKNTTYGCMLDVAHVMDERNVIFLPIVL